MNEKIEIVQFVHLVDFSVLFAGEYFNVCAKIERKFFYIPSSGHYLFSDIKTFSSLGHPSSLMP